MARGMGKLNGGQLGLGGAPSTARAWFSTLPGPLISVRRTDQCGAFGGGLVPGPGGRTAGGNTGETPWLSGKRLPHQGEPNQLTY